MDRPETCGTFLTNTVYCSTRLCWEAKNCNLIDATLSYSLKSMKQVQNVNKYCIAICAKNLYDFGGTFDIESLSISLRTSSLRRKNNVPPDIFTGKRMRSARIIIGRKIFKPRVYIRRKTAESKPAC
uniref:Uncharacterized protein n=1 Tax=Opuntia streptacantha TaxID=393608 RepID=A0A7C9E8Q2_OPUST